MKATNQEGLAAQAGVQKMARHNCEEADDRDGQRSRSADAPSNARSIAKIRSGRWRLISQQVEDDARGVFKLAACTTLKHKGVINVDFGKIMSTPAEFVTFTVASDGGEQSGQFYALPQLCLPEDIKDLILRRLISHGLPMLASHCGAFQIVEMVCAYDRYNCCVNAYTRNAVALAYIEASRFCMIPLRNNKPETSAYRDTEIVVIANAFNRTLLAMSMLVVVYEQVACLMPNADCEAVAKLKESVAPFIMRLAACRQGLIEVRRLMGLNEFTYEL